MDFEHHLSLVRCPLGRRAVFEVAQRLQDDHSSQLATAAKAP